jgi:hypothetical protein
LPHQDERIRALLGWFGSGAGPWSGFPGYEQAAERLLLEYSTASLVEAAASAPLSSAQWEGAARIFASWAFSKRPHGLDELPAGLKNILWSHMRGTQDEDKLDRASRAFRD